MKKERKKGNCNVNKGNNMNENRCRGWYIVIHIMLWKRDKTEWIYCELIKHIANIFSTLPISICYAINWQSHKNSLRLISKYNLVNTRKKKIRIISNGIHGIQNKYGQNIHKIYILTSQWLIIIQPLHTFHEKNKYINWKLYGNEKLITI